MKIHINFKAVTALLLAAAVLFLCSCGKISAESEGFSVGSCVDGTYTNNWMGIRFALPEDWSFMPNEKIPAYGSDGYFFGSDLELSQRSFTDYCNLNGFYAKSSDSYPNISLYFLNNLNRNNRYDSAQEFIQKLKDAFFEYFDNDVMTLEEGEKQLAETTYYYTLGNHGGEDQTYYYSYYAAMKGDIIIVWAINATQDNLWMADSLLQNALTSLD